MSDMLLASPEVDTSSFPPHWIVTIEPEVDGARNMERDVALARACAADGRPRLRLYSWKPWTLSLGHHQPEDSVNHDLLDRNGWGLVRRPTGGRGVFHAQEITYAVAMRGEGRGIHEAYAAIVDAIRRGLQSLGARDLAFSRSSPDFRRHYERDESFSCFSVSALNELTWHERKLVGSAQRRYDDILLQHGSLLLDQAHLSAVDLLHRDLSEERRRAQRQRLAERTVTLKEILGGALPSFMTIAEALADAFQTPATQ